MLPFQHPLNSLSVLGLGNRAFDHSSVGKDRRPENKLVRITYFDVLIRRLRNENVLAVWFLTPPRPPVPLNAEPISLIRRLENSSFRNGRDHRELKWFQVLSPNFPSAFPAMHGARDKTTQNKTVHKGLDPRDNWLHVTRNRVHKFCNQPSHDSHATPQDRIRIPICGRKSSKD